MKCEKCGYVSFDHNLTCPSCHKDLSAVRSKLHMFFQPPEADFDQYFMQETGHYSEAEMPQPARAEVEEDQAELDLDAADDDFEFTLDD